MNHIQMLKASLDSSKPVFEVYQHLGEDGPQAVDLFPTREQAEAEANRIRIRALRPLNESQPWLAKVWVREIPAGDIPELLDEAIHMAELEEQYWPDPT